jgi:hypothetical protein
VLGFIPGKAIGTFGDKVAPCNIAAGDFATGQRDSWDPYPLHERYSDSFARSDDDLEVVVDIAVFWP